jgi:hypothetical protein
MTWMPFSNRVRTEQASNASSSMPPDPPDEDEDDASAAWREVSPHQPPPGEISVLQERNTNTNTSAAGAFPEKWMQQLQQYQHHQQDEDDSSIYVDVEHLEHFQNQAKRLFDLGHQHMVDKEYKRAHASYAAATMVARLLEETVLHS